jgi:phosphatidylglycerol:prolipoprotein diacylglycerol transferase
MWVMQYLARRGRCVIAAKDVPDFIAMGALLGVFLGGRLGYVFFYYVPAHGWAALAQDPLLVVRVWEGGMASHGGILGLTLFTLVYSLWKRVPWTGVGDALCVGSPIGLFCGRMANFINGELYGRATTVPWAMKFPRSLDEENLLDRNAAWDAVFQVDPKLSETPTMDALAQAVRENPAVKHALEPYLTPRHPSQLYEGLLEGLVLFGLLFWVRMKFPKLPNGVITGLFFTCYAVFRIFVEQFREPDAALLGPLTKGQFLSLFMIIGGTGFLAVAWWRSRRAVNAPE